ncbi:MAG TPA: alpha/beta fold hydrolase [Roseiflexaceae bacterium]|nr:alpha/beta fold hydrolase [Roseiflexaceae bacterium]
MFALLGRALSLWLVLFELIAGWRRWWGLSWLGPAVPAGLRPALLFATMRGRRGSWRAWAAGLVLTLPPALLIQLAASSLRNQQLNPLLRLRPGDYPQYAITRLDIPMRVGHLPALHVVPTSGATAAVCVIHGSGCDKTSYAWRLVDELIERGLALLLIDVDGHGENPRAQSFPAIIEDADVAVAWLRERYERVGLLGISLGGCIAARAVADGLAVDALALMEAPALLRLTQADIDRIKRLEATGFARLYLLDLFADCTAYHMYRAWEYPPIRAQISTWDLFEALDLAGSLSKIAAPLLLIYGGSDAIVTPTQAAQVWAAMPEQARFEMVISASHLTMVLTPQALQIVGDWLRGTLAQSPVISNQ